MLRALNSSVPPGWLGVGGSGHPGATQGPQHTWPCPLAQPRGVLGALCRGGKDLSASPGVSQGDAPGAPSHLGGLRTSLCQPPRSSWAAAGSAHRRHTLPALGFHARGNCPSSHF